MKVQHRGSNVVASRGVKSESDFKILASSQAFRILSSGLYSDKVSAVLREIGCNAADSHIAAGCPDRPIEVKLPSALDRQFYIKDYGTGLTHEEITGLFTTYFSSNKSDTDDMTGALGLGSKSPFSYAESFSIMAAKDGVQRSYTAHVGEHGSPVISLLHECPATPEWPSGMMVSFPVKAEDIREFHDKAQSVFAHFTVKPDILGGEQVTAIESSIKGKSFYFRAQRGKGSAVIMGNVAYPLSLTKLALDANANLVEKQLIDAGIHLLVPIGSVMPTASREELEYDAKTRHTLLTRLEAASVELAKDILVEKALAPAPTEWERHRRALAFANELPGNIRQPHVLTNMFLKCGVDSAEANRIAQLYTRNYTQFENWVGALFVSGDSSFCKVHLAQRHQRANRFRAERRRVESGKIKRGQDFEKVNIRYDERVEVVYGDATYTYQRVKKYLEDEQVDSVIMVEAGNKETKPVFVKNYAERIAASLGVVPLKGSSTLELPVLALTNRKNKATKAAAFAQVYAAEVLLYHELSDAINVRSTAEKCTVAQVPAEGRYYLAGKPLKYGDRRFALEHIVFREGDISIMMKAYHRLRQAGVPLENIKGFVVLDYSQLRKLKLSDYGWKPLLETVKETIQSKSVLNDLKKKITPWPALSRKNPCQNRDAGLLGILFNVQWHNSQAWQYIKPRLKEFSALYSIWTELCDANDLTKKEGGVKLPLTELTKMLRIKLGGLPEQITDTELKDKILSAYPLTVGMDLGEFSIKLANKPQLAYLFLKQILIPHDALDSLLAEDPAQQVKVA